jgi:hypothetical protein
LYVWNLGFRQLFPKFNNNGIQFPVSQVMQIELGLIAAVALMGAAVQLRILAVLERKLKEIAEEQRKVDEEAELKAAERFGTVLREREEWERAHPTKGMHSRYDSNFSSMPLMKDTDGSTSPTLTGDGLGRPRYQSGVSEFLAASTPEEELGRIVRNQSPGVLPAMDLGLGIQDDVPQAYLTKEKEGLLKDHEAVKRKEELVAEIQTIRRSIDALRENSSPSTPEGSRRQSLTSRRTLSLDAHSALLPSDDHIRPPREHDPRTRTHSMQLEALEKMPADLISRPKSVPLADDWDAYVQDRKLLQPPAGVTPPIAVPRPFTPGGSKVPISRAVAEALNQRKRRESNLSYGEPVTDSSEDLPLSKVRQNHKRTLSGGGVPVTILPPRKNSIPIVAPTPQRPATKTFEELTERHREKMKGIQAPLTEAEKQQAELEAAKQRWERSKALEREAVTKRQAEKAALLEKRKRSEDNGERSGRHSTERNRSRHSRTLSADKLGVGSKRLSTMKVEDWMNYQETAGGQGTSLQQGVPFPDPSARRQ